MRHLVVSMCLLGLMAGSKLGLAQPAFELGFRGCGDIYAQPGALASGEILCTLTPSGARDSGDGAQGWSLSVVAEGVSIAEFTPYCTAADRKPVGLFDGGFQKFELTADGPSPNSCPGGLNGAICTEVLSLTNRVLLPIDKPSDIARLKLYERAPTTNCQPARVFYADGCRGIL